MTTSRSTQPPSPPALGWKVTPPLSRQHSQLVVSNGLQAWNQSFSLHLKPQGFLGKFRQLFYKTQEVMVGLTYTNHLTISPASSSPGPLHVRLPLLTLVTPDHPTHQFLGEAFLDRNTPTPGPHVRSSLCGAGPVGDLTSRLHAGPSAP